MNGKQPRDFFQPALRLLLASPHRRGRAFVFARRTQARVKHVVAGVQDAGVDPQVDRLAAVDHDHLERQRAQRRLIVRRRFCSSPERGLCPVIGTSVGAGR